MFNLLRNVGRHARDPLGPRSHLVCPVALDRLTTRLLLSPLSPLTSAELSPTFVKLLSKNVEEPIN